MRQRRAAFTLVEMLVAVALTLFIMVLLSQAFTTGLEAFRQLKAIGDMEERLRMASTLIRAELAADHFEGRKRLSDIDFFKEGPPRQGFFRIWQPWEGPKMTDYSYPEGIDGDTISSTRATKHILHFTVKRRGNGRENFFTTDIRSDPGAFTPPPPMRVGPWALIGALDSRYQTAFGIYTSQWAEVAYFLRPSGDTAAGNTLYTLYRRQRLLLTDNDDANWNTDDTLLIKKAVVRPSLFYSLPAYAEISCRPRSGTLPAIYFNNPTDVTVPQRRFAMNPKPTADGGIPVVNGLTYPRIVDEFLPQGQYDVRGDDVLLSDVLSFDVKIFNPSPSPYQPERSQLTPNPYEFVDLPPSLRNPLFMDNGPPQSRVHCFDTWSSVHDDVYDYSAWNDTTDPDPAIQRKRIPLPINIIAIKVTLRVWDHKTQRTRQVTIIQDM